MEKPQKSYHRAPEKVTKVLTLGKEFRGHYTSGHETRK